MQATYDRWYCTVDDLKDLDALRARDLIVECLFQAQHEALMRRELAQDLRADRESIRLDAQAMVRNAFMRVGGDYRNPTKDSLRHALNVLGTTADAMDAPDDIVEHHRQQISIVLASLPD